jgi:hypothetical protein
MHAHPERVPPEVGEAHADREAAVGIAEREHALGEAHGAAGCQEGGGTGQGRRGLITPQAGIFRAFSRGLAVLADQNPPFPKRIGKNGQLPQRKAADLWELRRIEALLYRGVSAPPSPPMFLGERVVPSDQTALGLRRPAGVPFFIA